MKNVLCLKVLNSLWEASTGVPFSPLYTCVYFSFSVGSEWWELSLLFLWSGEKQNHLHLFSTTVDQDGRYEKRYQVFSVLNQLSDIHLWSNLILLGFGVADSIFLILSIHGHSLLKHFSMVHHHGDTRVSHIISW